MRSTTIDTAFDAVTTADRPSLFSRISAAFMKNQEVRARRIVRAHLIHQDDATLARLGWSKAEIADLRRDPAVPLLPL